MSTTEKPRTISQKPFQKKRKRLLTPRQIKLAELVAENLKKTGQRKTMGQMMREAGYSVATSHNPVNAITAKTWQQLIDDNLPDELLSEAHGEILQASYLQHYAFPVGESDKEIKEIVETVKGCKLIKIRVNGRSKLAYFWAPDNASRIKAVAEGYKVKSKYPAEKHDIDGVVKVVKIVNYANSRTK